MKLSIVRRIRESELTAPSQATRDEVLTANAITVGQGTCPRLDSHATRLHRANVLIAHHTGMSYDTLLSDDDVESALSIAYVHAVAAHAGYTCGEPPGPDRDSVDIQISAGGHMRPKIDFQLKASIALVGNAEMFNYPLKIKNYNDLRVPTQTPRALIVLDLPKIQAEWLSITVDQMIIKRAAYWCSLAGLPEVTNTHTKTVKILKKNVFDVAALVKMMENSRSGKLT